MRPPTPAVCPGGARLPASVFRPGQWGNNAAFLTPRSGVTPCVKPEWVRGDTEPQKTRPPASLPPLPAPPLHAGTCVPRAGAPAARSSSPPHPDTPGLSVRKL